MGVAALAALAATLPAVWWEPLHVDEAITLRFAPESAPEILRDVFVERGGSPVFFLVEHLTLDWPGGVAGLRLPSLLFFVAALALAVPVARELAGRGEAVLLPPLLALAPLAVGLATFARMYSLLLAATLLSVWLLLRAVRAGTRSAWIVAGVATGLLVYVHPIAPLYGLAALATAFLVSGLTPGEAFRASRAGLASLAVVALPYAWALAVLTRRYGVGSSESSFFLGADERPVPLEALRALGPGGWPGAVAVTALAVVGAAALAARDRRRAAAVALWVVLPVAFFTLVPSETAFFPRYLLPALPFFLLLVAAGSLAVARRTGRPILAAALLVSALLAWEAAQRVERLGDLREHDLPAAVAAVAAVEDPVLLSSTGVGLGRPGDLLDLYVALELAGIERLEELPAADVLHNPEVQAIGTAAVREFLSVPGPPRRGVWLFSGREARLDRVERVLGRSGLATARASPTLLVVASPTPLPRRPLLEQAARIRRAWLAHGSRDRVARMLLAVERDALDARR